MNFIGNLGLALETALKAGAAHFATALGKTGGVVHVEYADQPKDWPKGASGRCVIRDDSFDTLEDYETTARTVFKFLLTFELKDVRGKKGALAIALGGLRNVLADSGSAVLDTHLVDTGSKRVGKSGSITFEPVVAEHDTLADEDEPFVQVRVFIDITHVVPL
jgi:hypothetical protein